VVIDVFCFFNLCGYRRAVVSTRQKAPKGELVFTIFRPIVTLQYVLHLVKQNGVNERFMGTPIFDLFPFEESR
jgi:hypothetical protein